MLIPTVSGLSVILIVVTDFDNLPFHICYYLLVIEPTFVLACRILLRAHMQEAIY